ncbi:MAG: hypothetical protein U5L09_04050 [Bacteroidales bacterium]|nr:hypothetical protein [Bacteroidales bacterium]
MGVAMLHLPFFLLAHLITLLLPFAANGYSPPYELAMYLSSIFYTLAGVYFLRKLLLKHFTEKITAWTIILVVFGTNLFFYSTLRTGTSHTYSFALITASLFFYEQWHEKNTWKTTIIIGILSGFIVLIRPTNVIIALVFILYGITNFRALKDKLSVFKAHYPKLLLILIVAFMVLFPQMVYWKWITGDWIYYSYKDEGFFFSDPELIKGLFSFRKGWLLYTPVMFFSVLGMIWLYQNQRKYMLAVPIFFLINIYIVYSWWAWWYGGSFSSRPMIDTYGLMAIPLAAFLKETIHQKKWIIVTIKTIFIALVILNLWQSKQYKRGIIHTDGMTKQSYLRSFFSWNYPKNYWKLNRPARL